MITEKNGKYSVKANNFWVKLAYTNDFTPEQVGLCQLVRKALVDIFFRIIILAGLVSILSIIASATAISVGHYLFHSTQFIPWLQTFIHMKVDTAAIITCAWVVSVISIMILYGFHKFYQWLRFRHYLKSYCEKNEKRESVLGLWLKSIHSKICPIIYIDRNE